MMKGYNAVELEGILCCSGPKWHFTVIEAKFSWIGHFSNGVLGWICASPWVKPGPRSISFGHMNKEMTSKYFPFFKSTSTYT